MTENQRAKVDAIRGKLKHPVIDSDGHDIEYLPLVRDYIRELAGQGVVDQFEMMVRGSELSRGLDFDTRRELGVVRIPWWALPTRNTRDRATAMLPRLLHERMDEFGFDFAVVYPTYGLMAMSAETPELRGAMCRAFNRYHAEVFDGLSDRLTPVAVIPMHTPEEAIAELDYAVGELGMKATLLAGHVLRPYPDGGSSRMARWLDTFGTESIHDYDPGLATLHRTGRGPDLPLQRHGLGEPSVPHQLRIQSRGQLRRGRRGRLSLTVPLGGSLAVPEPALCVPRGRGRLGAKPLLGPHRSLGEAEPRGHRSV